MALRELTTFEIAELQLNHAIKLFVQGEDMISVITLAGAAEEILGKLVIQVVPGKKNALQKRIDQTVELHRQLWNELPEKVSEIADYQNRARNALKHFDPKTLPIVRLDPEAEAIRMIDRALENFCWLRPRSNSLIRQYKKARNRALDRRGI
jgi:hypothetical protein